MLELIHQSVFHELTAILLLAASLGLAGHLLKQPLIVSFIAVGLIAGPNLLGIVKSQEQIDLLAELGIAVLLFLVGLKLDLGLVRSLGRVSLITGLGQVIFTSFFGFLIGLGLGFDAVTSCYIAVALTFSSTIIIVKLLTDKKEIDSLHGKIALGFLIVQDLVVVLAMLVISMMDNRPADTQNSALTFVWHAALAVGFVLVFIRYFAHPVLRRISRSPELLVIFAICWATLFTAVADHLGLSKELGGLLAGVSLASTPFRESIGARLASLRDFLLLFFFVAIGAKFDLSHSMDQIVPAILFSLFVLIGNPLIVMLILGKMGYRKRTGLLAGLTVAQISEFSLIFASMGVTLGHIAPSALGLVTFVGLVTIAVSVYMINYSHALYRWLEPVLGVFEFARDKGRFEDDAQVLGHREFDVILLGYGRYGKAISDELLKKGKQVLVVDFDPESALQWQKPGLTGIYGDATDPELFNELPVQAADWVLCCIPHASVGIRTDDPKFVVIQSLRHIDYQGKIGIVANTAHDVRLLQTQGIDLIFQPFEDAGVRAVERMYGAGAAPPEFVQR